jgi:hypothetical protein
MRPRFAERGSYISVRTRGNLIVEWVKRTRKGDDTPFYIYDFVNKRTFSFHQDKYHNFIDFSPTDIRQVNNETNVEKHVSIKPQGDGKVGLTFNIKEPDATPWESTITLEPWEVAMVRNFISKSVPYMAGWYGMYDYGFAKRNVQLETEDEFAFP